jgi:DNA polymerase-1
MTTLLLDGHNLLFRAFTSLPRSVAGHDGQPINGVYGLLGATLKLVRDCQAERVIAAFDVPDVPTFRHRLYAGYQAQRGPLGGEYADDFLRQTGIAQRILPSIGIPSLTAAGYEADDIIGTMATRLRESGDRAIIISTDRDLLQLVRPAVEVLTPSNPPLHVTDAAGVRARMGVDPEGIPTYKALAGDASDNVPGVAGIGVKTAAALVNAYGSLESIYESLGSLPARTAARLEAQRDEAFLFRTIVTIVNDLDVDIDLEALCSLHLEPAVRARSILDAAGY